MGDGSTVERVNGAEEVTADLVEQTATLHGNVMADDARVTAANTEAEAALAKEQAAFTDAATMADIMTNFDERAAGEYR